MMINLAAPSLISEFGWPAARILALILLSVYRCVHVTCNTLIAFIYHLIDSFRIWDPELVDPSHTSIFITGCASGFGFSLASRLDQMGYTVFAGVRVQDERSAKLKASCSHRLHLVTCDVTDKQSIQDAYNFIRENLNDKQLHAVVNNAGVVHVMPFEWQEEYESEVAINLTAPMNVTRTFLPLLRQAPGSRIVFVSSLAGKHECVTR
jgi:NAD(P)-dependent dehydrogenase (short-subunit alcohol dehydrogenase family)